jgi:endoglycosylceramidase
VRWAVRALALVLGGVTFVYLYFPTSPLRASVPPLQRPPAGSLPWISVSSDGSGHRLVDQSGRTVLLRGFNSEALLQYPDHEAAPLDQVDLELMKQSGFDVVRLPVSWSALEPVRGRLDAAYLESIVHMVDLVNSYGLYVIADMHFSLSWSPLYGGPGAPDWSRLPFYPDLHGSAPWQLGVVLNPAAVAATTYFWTSQDWQTDFEEVWRTVASRLRDRSGVVGYDLRNEPHPLPIPPRAFDDHYLWPFYQRTIEAIAHGDPNHLYIVEADSWGTGGTTIRQLQAPNLVYSPHLYYGSFSPPAFDGHPEGLRSYVGARVDEANRLGAPAWVGETGFDRDQPEAASFADEALDAYDDLDLGWAWWQWRQNGGWGIRSFDGRSLDVGYLRHLARPFLAAAPSGVRAARGDGLNGHLQISVAAAHGGAATEVSWPAVTLSAPLVSGRCVSGEKWTPGTGTLQLQFKTGVSCTVVLSGDPQSFTE